MLKKINSISILLLLAIFLLAGFISYDYFARKNGQPFTKTDTLMGTVVSQKLYGANAKNIGDKISQEIKRLEVEQLSWRMEGSDIQKINSYVTSVAVQAATAEYLRKSNEVSALSGGAFDLSVGKLSRLWDIGGENARVPSEHEIRNILHDIDYKKINVSGNFVTINVAQQLDLGAVGKGIACDSAKEILNHSKLDGAIISVGGSILLWGKDCYTVGIQNPRGKTNDYFCKLQLQNTCVSTSGDYERFVEQNGVKYHHILNPKTGWPAQSGLISVTIICESGFLSDALSTACFVLGLDKGMELLQHYDAQGIFVDENLNVYATDQIREKIEITDYRFLLAEK